MLNILAAVVSQHHSRVFTMQKPTARPGPDGFDPVISVDPNAYNDWKQTGTPLNAIMPVRFEPAKKIMGQTEKPASSKSNFALKKASGSEVELITTLAEYIMARTRENKLTKISSISGLMGDLEFRKSSAAFFGGCQGSDVQRFLEVLSMQITNLTPACQM